MPRRPPRPGKVSIVVPSWNAQPFLRRCLESIVAHTPPGSWELVVVDNGSTDGSKAWARSFLAAHPQLDARFLDNARNRYFSRGVNQGLRASAADAEHAIVFCNDVEVKADGWLDELVDAAREPDVIAVGHTAPARLDDEQRRLFARHGPVYRTPELTRQTYACIADPGFTYTHIYGYCFLVKKRLLAETGLYLETGDFRQYHSDWEWYVRFHAAGYRIAPLLPRVHHWHSVSELIAFHPERYRDLLRRIADPETLARDLQVGRPLYPEESGARSLAAAAAAAERATGDAGGSDVAPGHRDAASPAVPAAAGEDA